MITPYAKDKANPEPISKLPFNWRQGLPPRGWKVFSEEPAPGGRRHVAVQLENRRLAFQQHLRYGSGVGPAPKDGGQLVLTEAQMNEALITVNKLWATNPVFRDAHRTNVIHLVTVVIADGDVFKAFSSCDPKDELHAFNQLLWEWTGEKQKPAAAPPAETARKDA